jgi:hypothetical protein
MLSPEMADNTQQARSRTLVPKCRRANLLELEWGIAAESRLSSKGMRVAKAPMPAPWRLLFWRHWL